MAAALLSKEENTVLIFAGQIMSEHLVLLFLYMWLVWSLMRPFLCNSRCFWQDLHLATAEEISFCAYHYVWNMPTSPWLCGKKHCMSCWNTNGSCWSLNICTTDSSKFPPMRLLVDISINHYQIANARKLMHPQTITETFLRSRNCIASGFILYQLFLQHPSLPPLVFKINLLSSESTTKDHLPLVV